MSPPEMTAFDRLVGLGVVVDAALVFNLTILAVVQAAMVLRRTGGSAANRHAYGRHLDPSRRPSAFRLPVREGDRDRLPDVGECFLASVALTDAPGQRRAGGHEAAVLVDDERDHQLDFRHGRHQEP